MHHSSPLRVVRMFALGVVLLALGRPASFAVDAGNFRAVLQQAQAYRQADADAYARALAEVQPLRSNGQRDLLVPATASREERTLFVFWSSFENAYWRYHGQSKPAAPAPAKIEGVTAYSLEQVGQMSQTLSPDQIQKLIASLNNSNPTVATSAGRIVVTGAGGLIIANGTGKLIGNNGAALANNGDPLAQVTPATAMVTGSFSMPSASRQVQTVNDPQALITAAFQSALRRNPTADELAGWTQFIKKYPKSTLIQSAGDLARILAQVAPPPSPPGGATKEARPGRHGSRGATSS